MERKPQKTIKFGVISHYDNFKDCHNVTLVVILLQFTKTQMSDQSSLVGNHEMIVNIITFISFFFHLYRRSKKWFVPSEHHHEKLTVECRTDE